MSTADSDDASLLASLALTLTPGIGPRMSQLLRDHFGSPEAIFAATEQQLLKVPGVGQKLARGIVNGRDFNAAREELARCKELGVRTVLPDDSEYPRMLGEMSDAPTMLYLRGRLEAQDELAVAIVGSRRCTAYGTKQAEHLSRTLARAGITIVSGLARGIDAAAHRGALAAGGRTVAVMATGLAKTYPPEHADLAAEIAETGANIAEFPLEQDPVRGLFPQRNRIISGMSLGVIIVEASRNSGALHTARHAMEQGRDVFAVPGRVDSLASEGCHDLIRDGVILIRGADDVLESLGPLTQPVERSVVDTVHSARELSLNDRERTVLNLVSAEPMHQDEILRAADSATDLDASQVLSTLTILEMKRFLRRMPGGYLARTP